MKDKPHKARATLCVRFFVALFVVTLSSCVKLPRHAASAIRLPATSANDSSKIPAPRRINLNTATREELEKLPGIGEGFAARIISHRERYGHFRRSEHLLMVRGISDRRFQALRPFITLE